MNDGTNKRPLTVVVEAGNAEVARAVILEHGLFDPRRSIGRDDKVHFPVILSEDKDENWLRHLLPQALIIQGDGLTVARESNDPPFLRIRDLLSAYLEPHEIDLLPSRWKMIGDCLLLRLSDLLCPRKTEIAKAYSQVLGSRYVLEDIGGIKGELREPDFTTLIPPKDGVFDVVHNEGSCSFQLDPRRIMFSPGNTDIRVGMSSILASSPPPPRFNDEGEHDLCKGERILDMFAGIGYFTIPLALDLDPDKIVAVEKNPLSFGYLQKNIRSNKVGSKVEPLLGDNRDVSPRRYFDRIMMGYIGGTVDFITAALSTLRPEGGILHLQDTIEIEIGVDGLFQRVERVSSGSGFELELIEGRRIKSFAPRIDHVMVDVLATPENGP